MLARDVMVTKTLSVLPDQDMGTALDLMRRHHYRMLPVVDADNCLCGAITTSNILRHLLPDYILSGELGEVAYAPDIAVLTEHYPKLIRQQVSCVMDTEPLTVQDDESLLAVASTLAADTRQHVYALVLDAGKRLVGIISPGDILDHFRLLHLENSSS